MQLRRLSANWPCWLRGTDQRSGAVSECAGTIGRAAEVPAMPKRIDISSAPAVIGTGYPPPFDLPCQQRMRRRLGDVAGLTQFGVNLTRLPPGTWSSQRHWHTEEDEFIFVVEGELVLVTDAGEEILRAGDCAGFKAGVADGHHVQNRSPAEAAYLEIGARRTEVDEAWYPEIDLKAVKNRAGFAHRDGRPYPPNKK
jgi:uncharacterized cupin superfamily protein